MCFRHLSDVFTRRKSPGRHPSPASDGSPLREFLYVDDLANLCVFLMNNYSGNETVNAGTGKELTIRELTEIVAGTVGYEGKILWDTEKPNGTRANFWMCRKLRHWDGAPAQNYATGSAWHTRIS